MPPVKTKPPSSPKGKKGLDQPTNKEVIYSDMRVNGVLIPPEKVKITAAKMKEFLGWQSELEYDEEKRKEDPNLKEDAPPAKFKDDDILLVDITGQRIRCKWNSRNRPFDLGWSKEIAQAILTRTYHLNGETIVISRTGVVTSGQHRGIGLILAVQQYNANNAYWSKYWSEEPYIESLVVTGGSDDPDVIRTQDNVKPRTLADVCYTSPLFQNMPKKERGECSRMLARAIDTLWKRVDMAEWIPPGMQSKKEGKDGVKENKERRFHHYQTHSESLEFRDHHPRLLDCVKHLHDANSANGRALSTNKLSAGECAAVMYLMAFGGSDRAKYLKCNPPAESALKFDKKTWDRASQFWGLFAAKAPELTGLYEALAELVDVSEMGGRRQEKLAVLSKAWQLFKDEEPITKDNVRLAKDRDYGYSENGEAFLKDAYTFGGIDVGEQRASPNDEPDEATSAKQAAEKEAIRKEQARKLAERFQKDRKGGNGTEKSKPSVLDYTPPVEDEGAEPEENNDEEPE